MSGELNGLRFDNYNSQFRQQPASWGSSIQCRELFCWGKNDWNETKPTNFLLKIGKHQYLNVSHKNLKRHSWGGSLLEWEIAVDLFVGLLTYDFTAHPPLVVVRMPMAYRENQLVGMRLDWWLLHAKAETRQSDLLTKCAKSKSWKTQIDKSKCKHLLKARKFWKSLMTNPRILTWKKSPNQTTSNFCFGNLLEFVTRL